MISLDCERASKKGLVAAQDSAETSLLWENCFASSKLKEPGKSDMKKSTTLTCIFFMNGFTAGIAC
jgi:hypothetical protein